MSTNTYKIWESIRSEINRKYSIESCSTQEIFKSSVTRFRNNDYDKDKYVCHFLGRPVVFYLPYCYE